MDYLGIYLLRKGTKLLFGANASIEIRESVSRHEMVEFFTTKRKTNFSPLY